VEALEGILGKNAVVQDTPTPPTEPLITYADISKARKLLAYEPRVQVEEGLEHFIRWLRAEGLLAKA
jgi:UDP-glucuronate 4-epimerase